MKSVESSTTIDELELLTVKMNCESDARWEGIQLRVLVSRKSNLPSERPAHVVFPAILFPRRE